MQKFIVDNYVHILIALLVIFIIYYLFNSEKFVGFGDTTRGQAQMDYYNQMKAASAEVSRASAAAAATPAATRPLTRPQR